jgi:hypothetical protein
MSRLFLLLMGAMRMPLLTMGHAPFMLVPWNCYRTLQPGATIMWATAIRGYDQAVQVWITYSLHSIPPGREVDLPRGVLQCSDLISA